MAHHMASLPPALRGCILSARYLVVKDVVVVQSMANRRVHPLLRRRLVTMPRRGSHDAAASKRASAPSSAIDSDHKNPSFKVTKLSYEGTIKTVDLQTSELLRSASIFARDLFTLNLTSRQERRRRRGGGGGSLERSTVSEIDPRVNLIILSFGNIRAVATLDYIFLFEAHSPHVREFARDLARTFRSGATEGEPHELVFLEAVLKDTVESFGRRLRLFEPLVDTFLDKVTDELYHTMMPSTWYSSLVPLQDSLQSFEIQVQKSFDTLTELLNKDDEMLGLLLTEQAAARESGEKVDFSRHEHVELLIGVYARQINNILMEIHFLLKRIQSKQNFITITMSAYRNRMVRMNVNIGIAALSLGFGTTVAGFFGMNLISGLEQSPYAFYSVIGLSGIGAMLIATGSLNYASGRYMKQRAASRLEQNEIVSNALSDISALDFTIKSIEKHGGSLDKDQFRSFLKKARHTKQVSNEEVDLLFEVFDRVKDGQLTKEDFQLGLYEGKEK